MNGSDLFSQEMEPALRDWIRQFTLSLDLLSALPWLYVSLRSQHVLGTAVEPNCPVAPGTIANAHTVLDC